MDFTHPRAERITLGHRVHNFRDARFLYFGILYHPFKYRTLGEGSITILLNRTQLILLRNAAALCLVEPVYQCSHNRSIDLLLDQYLLCLTTNFRGHENLTCHDLRVVVDEELLISNLCQSLPLRSFLYCSNSLFGRSFYWSGHLHLGNIPFSTTVLGFILFPEFQHLLVAFDHLLGNCCRASEMFLHLFDGHAFFGAFNGQFLSHVHKSLYVFLIDLYLFVHFVSSFLFYASVCLFLRDVPFHLSLL